MKKFRKILALAVAVSMLAICMAIPVFAEEAATDTTDTQPDAATIATDLGMLKGDGNGVTAEYLAKPTVRIQAAIMELRIMGLEADALAYDGDDTFNDPDASDFQKPILAYLKANPDLGWIGDNDGNFNPNAKITAQEYYKVMLVCLGYEYGVDFTWEDTLGFSKAVGVLSGDVPTSFANNDVAVATVSALKTDVKGGGMSLADQIAASNTDFAAKAADLGLVALVLPSSVETLDDIAYTVGDDATAKLPATVTVTYSDGSTKDVAVTWPDVSTDAATTEAQTITGTLEGISDLTATVKYTVAAVAIAVDSVAVKSLGEVEVNFNTAIDATKLTTLGNYTVAVGTSTKTIVAATASSDNKSVVLTLAATTTLSQLDAVTVTIGTGTGLAAAVVKTIASASDTTVPSVTSAAAVGNKQITVTFSEPVKAAGANVIGNYKIDGNFFNGTFSGTVSTDRKTVTINVTNRLTAGEHTIVVSNVVDDANYPVGPNSSKFTVVADTTAPAIAKLVSCSQTTLVVEFTKEIETPAAADITSTQGTVSATTLPAVSGKQLTVTFQTAAPLPTTPVTITFNNITDMYANKAAALTLSVTAVPDTTRPEIKSVTADTQTAIVVAFSKAVVANTANYTVKDSAGNPVTVAAVKGTAADATDATKVSLNAAYAAGTYTVYVSGVVDDNPLNNVVLPAVYSVTVPDKTPPVIVAQSAIPAAGIIMDTVNNKLFIQFSKAVTAATATAIANYSYVNSATGLLGALPADTTAQLLSDGKTACLTFVAATLVVTNIQTLQVGGVTDTAGNVMATVSRSQAFATLAAGVVSPTIASVKATSATTLVATLIANSSLIGSTVTLSDFTVTAGAGATLESLVPTAIAYDGTTTPAAPTITITLASGSALNADGSFGATKKAVTVTTITTPNAKDIYSTALAGGVAKLVSDAIVPASSVGSAVYSAATTVLTVKINLNEPLNLAATVAGSTPLTAAIDPGLATDVSGQFIVTLDGVTKAATGTYVVDASLNASLQFALAAGTTGTTVRVVYFPTATQDIKDRAAVPNNLPAFDYSITVTNGP